MRALNYILLGFLAFAAPAFSADPPTPAASPSPTTQGQPQPSQRSAATRLLDAVMGVRTWIVPQFNFGNGNGNGTGRDPNAAINGIAGVGGRGRNGNGSGGSGSGGSGAGSGAGNNSPPPGSEAGAGDGDGHHHGPDTPLGVPSPPGRVIGGNGNSVAFSLWFPMCLFVDPSAVGQGEANAAVKGLVDNAAACQVNLVVFPITVRPGSYANGKPEATNAQQIQACNLANRLDNATRASTSICVNHTQMADIMCGSTPKGPDDPDRGPDGIHTYREVSGCAQLNASPESMAATRAYIESLRTTDPARYEEIKNSKEGNGGGGSSSIAPSIEDTGACNAGTVGHEALGHSMFGHPNGASSGEGIGLRKTGGGGGGWTPEGCAAMRANAFTNSGKWRWAPNRTTYYRETKPQFQWDLSSGKQLIGPRTGPPPPGPVTRDQTGGGDTGRVVFDDSAKKERPGKNEAQASPPPTGPGQVASSTPDTRHQGAQPGTDVGKELLENLKEVATAQGADTPPPQDVYTKPVPQGPAGSAGSARVTFDDSAKKGSGTRFTDYGASGRLSDRSPGSGGSASSARVVFDDTAKKGSGSGGGGGSSGGGSGGGSGSSGGGAGDANVTRGGGGAGGAAGSGLGQLDGEFFNTIARAEEERRREGPVREKRPKTIVEEEVPTSIPRRSFRK